MSRLAVRARSSALVFQQSVKLRIVSFVPGEHNSASVFFHSGHRLSGCHQEGKLHTFWRPNRFLSPTVPSDTSKSPAISMPV